MAVDEKKVEFLVALNREWEDKRYQFSKKYDFAYKRAQNFKNCIVIRWKMMHKKDKINHPRIEEYISVVNHLSNKYDLWEKEAPFFDKEFRLLKIGIYCFTSWDHPVWAIPNEFKDIQEDVINQLPAWATITIKK